MTKRTEKALEFWSKHIEAAANFKGSCASYCRAHDLNIRQFYTWKKRLAQGSLEFKKSDFVSVIVSEPRSELTISPNTRLPEAQWVAQVMLHLIRGLA